MPVQTIRCFPGTDYDFTYGGGATVAWSPVPVAAIVDDPAGAPDGVAGRFTAAFAAARTAYAEYKSASIPSGILSVSAVRMKARFLATGTGGTYDLVVTGFVRPSGAGTGATGAFFYGSPVTITSETGAGEVYHDETVGSWSVDPNTSVSWLASTLRAMSWGVRFAAPATDPAVNGSVKLDQVYLEIDFVLQAADIDGVRANGSSFLRLFHREPELVEITGPMLLGDADVLEHFGMEHPEAPRPDAAGWGPELWNRGLPLVLSRTVDLLANTVKVLALNPRRYMTRWWSTFLTDMGHSLDGQGIPLLHSGGGGIVVDRGQEGYVERSGAPPDGVIMAAGEDQPKYDRRGLLVEGAGATNLVLHSTFSGGTGNTFTNWTKGESGTGTVTEHTGEFIGFDETGLRRSVHLSVGATDASIATVGSDGISVTTPFRGRVRGSNQFGSQKLGVAYQRSSDSLYWNPTSEAWEAFGANTIIRTPNVAGPFDLHTEMIDPGGAETITVYLGYFGEASTADYQAYGWSVELYEGSPTHIGSDLPTTTVAVTRVEDVVTIDNSEVGRMWPGDAFGSFVLAVTPWWNSADLASGEEKVFWHCKHKGDGTHTETILYKQGTGYIYRRTTEGNDYDAVRSVSGAALPTRDVQQKITVRWVADGGELGMMAYSHEIAVDGVWGTHAVIEDPMVLEPTATVYVGSNGDDSWGDAFLVHADVSPFVLTDEEMARRAP